MAAERGGGGNVRPFDDADRGRGVRLVSPRIDDAIHLEQHPAALELGHGEFLAADRVCIRRSRAGVVDERGSKKSAKDFSARDSRLGRRNRGDLYRGNDRRAVVDEQRVRGSEKRRVSGADDCFGHSEDYRAGNHRGSAGDRGKCRRRGFYGGGNLARPVCRRRGSLFAACIRQSASQVADTVRFHSGAGRYFRRDFAAQPDQ